MEIEEGVYRIRTRFTHGDGELEVVYDLRMLASKQDLKNSLEAIESYLSAAFTNAANFDFTYRRIGDSHPGWMLI